jgi:hypothetical protein
MQTTWATQINPVLQNPLVSGHLIRNLKLSMGANVINHGLGRNLQGWVVTRLRDAPASFYDTQDTNQMPALTLNLNASAAANVDIWCF